MPIWSFNLFFRFFTLISILFQGSKDEVATKLCVEKTIKYADTNFTNCPSRVSERIEEILKVRVDHVIYELVIALDRLTYFLELLREDY